MIWTSGDQIQVKLHLRGFDLVMEDTHEYKLFPKFVLGQSDSLHLLKGPLNFLTVLPLYFSALSSATV